MQQEHGIAWGVEMRSDISEIKDSKESHDKAKNRTPPVDIGDISKTGVIEITTDHRNEKQALCEVEGFKIFVENIPESLTVGDVIRSKVVSFNRGRSSAKAIFEEKL